MTLAMLYTIGILAGGGVVLLLANRRLPPRWSALASLAVGLLALLPLLLRRGPEEVLVAWWIPVGETAVAIVYRFDALAQAMALGAALPALLLLLWMALGAPAREGRFAPWVLLLLGLYLHLLGSADLLLAYAGWEVLLLAGYLLLVYRRSALPMAGAAEWFLGGQYLAGLPLLLALAWTGSVTGTWQYAHMEAGAISLPVLALLLVTAWVRTAQFPFQEWALAVAESPGPISTLVLGGWGLLVGPYLWLRCLPLLAKAPPYDWALAAGSVGLLLGTVLALRQEGARRVQAADSVARLGLVWMALGLAGPLGTAAAMFLLLDLLLSKVAFHLALAPDALGRRAARGLFALGAWQAAGLPPSLGFVGRWLLVLGLLAAGRPLYIALLLLVLPLTLGYLWRGWLLAAPGASGESSRLDTVARCAVAVLAGLPLLGGLAAHWLWPAILAPALAPLQAGAPGAGPALAALSTWMPAGVLIFLLVGLPAAWWSGALRPGRAADDGAALETGPLREALAVLSGETAWLDWPSHLLPLFRLLARAAGLLALGGQRVVNFFERHTTYFLLVVLLAAAAVLIALVL